MIDTIRGTVKSDGFLNLNSVVNYWSLRNNGYYNERSNGKTTTLVAKYPTDLVKKYGYLPKTDLVFVQSSVDSLLLTQVKIEFSAPKLIYGSNFYHVQDLDLPLILERLSAILIDYGINLNAEELKKLQISTFAVCFNIVVPSHFGNTLTYMDSAIRCLDQGKKYKFVANTEYNQTETGLKIAQYSKLSSFKYYILSSNIINQAKTDEEKKLKELFLSRDLTKNILRIEKTFQKAQSVKRIVHRILKEDENSEVYIGDIFNKNLCQQLLTECITNTADNSELLAIELGNMSENTQTFQLTTKLLEAGVGLGLKNCALAQFVLNTLIVRTSGWHNFNYYYDSLLQRTGSKFRSLIRNKIKATLANQDLNGFDLLDLFNEIKDQLKAFTLYNKIEQFQIIYKEKEEKTYETGTVAQQLKKP